MAAGEEAAAGSVQTPAQQAPAQSMAVIKACQQTRPLKLTCEDSRGGAVPSKTAPSTRSRITDTATAELWQRETEPGTHDESSISREPCINIDVYC